MELEEFGYIQYICNLWIFKDINVNSESFLESIMSSKSKLFLFEERLKFDHLCWFMELVIKNLHLYSDEKLTLRRVSYIIHGATP